MLRPVIDFGRQVLTLTTDVKQAKEDIRAIREDRKEDQREIKILAERLDRLSQVVQALWMEVQHQAERNEQERKLHRLEVENLLLREGRSLPARPPVDEDNAGRG